MQDDGTIHVVTYSWPISWREFREGQRFLAKHYRLLWWQRLYDWAVRLIRG